MRIFIICHLKAICLKRSYNYQLKSDFPSGKSKEHPTGGDEQSSALWGENALKVRSEGVDVQKKSVQAWKGEEISDLQGSRLLGAVAWRSQLRLNSSNIVSSIPSGLLLEPETYTALISTMRRDCRVLESFKIMDYSLLLGIHNLDRAAREREEEEKSAISNNEKAKSVSQQKAKLVAHSTAMESIQATSDPVDIPHELQGGMPARNHKGERILIFVGIIDILQSYRLSKKLEHTFKAIIHDGVSKYWFLLCWKMKNEYGLAVSLNT